MDVVPLCTCNTQRCRICSGGGGLTTVNQPLLSIMEAIGEFGGIRALDCLPRFIVGAVSGTITGFFALAGGFTGAVTGALAGRASDCGVLRGAGLGAIAGAILSVEVLEASRAYWCLEQSGSRGPSSMADFIEELVRGRLADEHTTPEMFHWQVGTDNITYNEVRDVYGGVTSRGLSGDSLKNLPCYTLDDIKGTPAICCTICLQDFEMGEIVRSLPQCHHIFHLACIDKWLVKHGSCPVCRQDL